MNILIDKKENWSFLELGQFDIENIKKEVVTYFSEWLIDTERQETFVTHEDTYVLELKCFDYLWYIGEQCTSKTKNSLYEKKSIIELENIYSKIEKIYKGRIIRSEIVNLKPYGRIRSHKDRGDNLFLGRRIHIPLKTNEHCVFSVGEKSIVMGEGYAYEINNSKYHKVNNYYSDNRIHLIVDVLPSEYIDGIDFA